MICTFYSFKGGVGRSMALANIAEHLYARGLKVLMIDFDLEAPGLERYFDVTKALVHPQEVLSRRGVIDMLLSYVDLRAVRRSDSASSKGALSTPVEPLSEFVVRLYEKSHLGGELAILPAGRRDGDEFTAYAERIRSFDWDDFYDNEEGEAFFEWFRKQADAMADVILIDSRTGVSEMSGVCTYQLADAVVMFVAPNRQNLDGTLMMANSLSDPALIEERGRPLSLLFVPSRVEYGEAKLLDEFAREFDASLNAVERNARSLEGTSFDDLKLVYVPHYAYMEKVAMREAGASASDLVKGYERIAAALAQLDKPDSSLRRALHSYAQPFEELVLELTDLRFHEQSGVRRASARARLVYKPAEPGLREITSARSWRFLAPIGPLEVEELRWYLEKYAIWPSDYFRERARKVEESLVKWGQLLHEAALPVEHTSNVLQAWSRIEGGAGRRFSVKVDAALEAGAPSDEVEAARESATLLLGLPWELLHDRNAFLFQGVNPVCVRRCLPNTRVLEVPVVAPPIRILLVSPRPEDDACGYIDHRATALPLVEAMEKLGGLVRIHVLAPPTMAALRDELHRADSAGEPYHVVHFDGPGTYDRRAGLGGLCFEDPQDIGKLEMRRHVTVNINKLGPLLSDHRIPLVFLEASQTAHAEKASESVASELLKVGVTSVVAMSHSMLTETARRFVESFYDALARGARVGDAMLAGQRTLKDDSFRGRIFGAGELRLEDWFVPVLFQEQADPQLFRTMPSRQAEDALEIALAARLGELPGEPETGFIGRSRELLALQRLLRQDGKGVYAVIRGQGGEGKTTLAAEFARWMVRSHQISRAVFLSVATHSTLAAVLDAIGRQLVPGYSVATFNDLEEAILPVERALDKQSTLVVVDNMESILLPPYLQTPAALTEETRRELDAILDLCRRLNTAGETRFVFTSREALPAPFDDEQNRRELHRLDGDDAVKLVERVLNLDTAGAGAAVDAARESIEQLVEAAHGHARTLALLAPALRSHGVEEARGSLVDMLAEMERKFPAGLENPLFATVELSLDRMSSVNRDRVRTLGVFHGGVDLDVLREMTGWEKEAVRSLAVELIGTGLATPDPYNHLTLNPALCPYLAAQLEGAERESLATRWLAEMRRYVDFLVQQHSKNIELAATLTLLELANLFALLDQVELAGDSEETIDLATSLFVLLQKVGKPRLLERIAQARDGAAAALGTTWNRARFRAYRTRIEQELENGRFDEAFRDAQELLRHTRTAGKTAYPDADYDVAYGYWLFARVLQAAGGSEQALRMLDEAQRGFEAAERDQPGRGAERMASLLLTERGDCLLDLGRLDEAATAYDESIRRAEQYGDERSAAVGKAQLGTVRLTQRLYPEALAAYEEARERFTRLDEPGTVATIWHQTGIVYQNAGQIEAAEDSYRKSLALAVRLGNVAGQASTLGQLGTLYGESLHRPEEALAFLRQAIAKYAEIGDVAREGRQRSNLAVALTKVRRLEEARQEIRRAIDCTEQFGHASEPWKLWAILAQISTEAGDPAAAAEAKRKSIEHYLAYRRDGGENHYPDGRISFAVSQALLRGDPEAGTAFLQRIAAEPELPAPLTPFVRALQSIVGGSRDRSLAATADLDYTMAAEILFLIETLENASRPSQPGGNTFPSPVNG